MNENGFLFINTLRDHLMIMQPSIQKEAKNPMGMLSILHWGKEETIGGSDNKERSYTIWHSRTHLREPSEDPLGRDQDSPERRRRKFKEAAYIHQQSVFSHPRMDIDNI